jgi:ribosomal protein S8
MTIKKKEIKYKNQILDSNEEKMMCHYLEELQKNGYIKPFKKNTKSMEIFPSRKEKIEYLDKKNEVKNLEKHFLHGLSYTYDFMIEWLPKAKNIFYVNIFNDFAKDRKTISKVPFFCLENDISIIDVKGSFAGRNNNSAITFPIIQKLLYDGDIYVQKIIPKKLFQKTFVPPKELLTPTGKTRKFNFPIKLLKDYEN